MDGELRAQGLRKRYGPKEVVRGVDLALRRGEIVALFGPNGAGKTTTFYMVVGFIRPTGGRIYLKGQEITALPMYKRARLGLGYLPQEPSAFRRMTALENLPRGPQALFRVKAGPDEEDAVLVPCPFQNSKPRALGPAEKPHALEAQEEGPPPGRLFQRHGALLRAQAHLPQVEPLAQAGEAFPVAEAHPDGALGRGEAQKGEKDDEKPSHGVQYTPRRGPAPSA